MFLKVLEFFSNILSSTNIMYVWLHMYLCQIRYYRSLMQMPIINLKFCIVRIFAARNKVSANKIVRFCTTDDRYCLLANFLADKIGKFYRLFDIPFNLQSCGLCQMKAVWVVVVRSLFCHEAESSS